MREIHDQKEKPTVGGPEVEICFDRNPKIYSSTEFAWWDGRLWHVRGWDIPVTGDTINWWREIEPWDSDPARLDKPKEPEPPPDDPNVRYGRIIEEVLQERLAASREKQDPAVCPKCKRLLDGQRDFNADGARYCWDCGEFGKPGVELNSIDNPALCPKCGKLRRLHSEREWNFLYCFECHSSESVSHLTASVIERQQWQRLNAERELAQKILVDNETAERDAAERGYAFMPDPHWVAWAKAELGEEEKP